MGQIVRRKRKGRPSNSDRARRSSPAAPPSPVDRRSSRRRRNVRYNFDIDDYVDDAEFYDDDDVEIDIGRREKKIRLLLLENDDSRSNRRVAHAPSSSSSEYDYEDDDCKPSKKRKLEEEDYEDNEIEEIRGRKLEEEDDEEEEEEGGSDFACGTLSDHSKAVVPLPDKKTLELILEKLQKKDIYGVYAEPVDPDELPDYHDVIKHPMDFATIRKKLAKGLYLTLKEFESDVFLICANAMQYNAPDTIYYKQASSIQEQAKLRFQRLRAANVDRSEIELKTEQKTLPNFTLPKKQFKKPVARTVQDPVDHVDRVDSETFSGAIDRTGDFPNGSSGQTPVRLNSYEVAENSSLPDNSFDKDQDQDLLPGKTFMPKVGKNPSVIDENRRATYNVSVEQQVTDSDSVLSTFEGEIKQFIPVGLHADHSYARSLARFAGTLGPVAWKIASQTIEQALPEGVKFGPGWVGEYEPLSTPVLIPENKTLKEPDFLSYFKINSNIKETKKDSNFILPIKDNGPDSQKMPVFINPRIPVKQESFKEARKHPNLNPNLNPKPNPNPSPNLNPNLNPAFFSSFQANTGSKRPISNASDIPQPVSRSGNVTSMGSFRHPNSNNDGFAPGRPSSNASDINSPRPSKPASMGPFMHQNSNNDGFAPGRLSSNASDINSPRPSKPASIGPFMNQNSNNDVFAPGRPSSNVPEIPSPRPSKPVSRNGNLVPMGPFMHPNGNNDGFAPGRVIKPVGPDGNMMGPVPSVNNLPYRHEGKPIVVNRDSNRMENNTTRRPDQQGLSDPVQMMKTLSEKSQNQQNNSNGFGFGLKTDGSTNVAQNQQNKSNGYGFGLKTDGSTNVAQNQQNKSNGFGFGLKTDGSTNVAQNQENKSNVFGFGPKTDGSTNVALTAAQAWMSLGAGGFGSGLNHPPITENNPPAQKQPDSIYNPTHHRQQPQASRFRGEFPTPGPHFQPVNPFPPQPVRMVNESQLQNRNVGFPPTDLSRFQVQSNFRVNPQMQNQSRPKQQESRPVDLNIGYQSMGSPVRQSSGMLVDSQQPDLALQL